VSTTVTEIAVTNNIPAETPEEKALRESKEQLVLINAILERPEIKRILDNLHVALPFLSDTDSEEMTVKIIKFRATSIHTAKSAAETLPGDDCSFLVGRTKNLKDTICKLFDDLLFYIKYTRGIDSTALDEEQERTELRYIDICHIISNAYREMTNLPIIEMPVRLIAPQGTQKKVKRPYIQ
jgi:hypothetical protein